MAIFGSRSRGQEPQDSGLPAQALARILELVERVGAVERPEDVLDAAVDAAIDLTEAERGWILIQPPEGRLEVACARRRDGGALEDALSKISRTVLERAFQEDRPLCVDEAREDATLGAARSVAEMRLRAVLCVPFRLEDARGAFYLDNRFAAAVFNERTLRLLSTFTGPVAMILRHSQLESQLAEAADALGRANRELDGLLRDRTEEVVRLEGLARHPAGSGRTDPFPEVLGESPALLRALGDLGRAAGGEFPVLLRGESGTGKDLAARALHRASGRGEEPFVPVALAGLSPTLLEGELFGVSRGAYTGAEEDREGLIATAGVGTLYLDGIDALPLDVQPKLLRVLEDGSYMRVGGGMRQSRARLVVAAHSDLNEAVAAGRFREDLYYRVRVVEIVLPPLRQRAGDLRLLLEHFLAAAADGGEKAPPFPSGEDWNRLREYEWPGNVRELANFATRWVAYGGELPESEWQRLFTAGGGAEAPTLREAADHRLLAALEEAGGNKAEAARRLGISRRTLYNRLRALGR